MTLLKLNEVMINMCFFKKKIRAAKTVDTLKEKTAFSAVYNIILPNDYNYPLS